MRWSKQVIRKSIRPSFLPDFPTGFPHRISRTGFAVRCAEFTGFKTEFWESLLSFCQLRATRRINYFQLPQ
jgi:hypothetical protein